MKVNKNKIGTNILITSLAISGLFSITSGAVVNKFNQQKTKEFTVKVIEKSTAKTTDKTPKLKEITTEENIPLSVNVKDYIENLNELSSVVVNKYKLDTSLVNLSQPGKYTYTITYKDKKYNGVVIVKEKALPVVNTLTLKEVSIEKGTALNNDASFYIVDTITDEVKNNLKLDLTKVNINEPGTYQYTVTYNGSIYTGSIIVFEKQKIETPKEENKDENQTQNNQEQNTNQENNQ